MVNARAYYTHKNARGHSHAHTRTRTRTHHLNIRNCLYLIYSLFDIVAAVRQREEDARRWQEATTMRMEDDRKQVSEQEMGGGALSVLESPPSLSVPFSLIPHSAPLVSISACTCVYV